jgi:hypothetical protein
MKVVAKRMLNVLALVAVAFGLIVILTNSAIAGIDGAVDTVLVPESNSLKITANAAPGADPAWTIIVYLNGDNSLDESTFEAFNRMEIGACNPNVDFVVRWDRSPGHPWDSGTRRYKVKCDENLDKLANYVEGIDTWYEGELNMGDDQVFRNFVNNARADYPADHYLLSIADHGGGWSPSLPLSMRHRHGWMAGGTGVSWDETGPDPNDPDDLDYLSTHEVGSVLNSLSNGGTNPFDIVFYDACLMGMLEEAYEIKDYAYYFIASENIAWDIFRYDDYVAPITAATQPAELAEHIVTVYGDFLRNEDYAGTMTALDLSATDAVSTAVDALAQALIAELSNATIRGQIDAAYVAAQKLDYDSNGEIEQDKEGYVDLYDLADKIKQTVTSTTIINAAQGVMDVLDTSGFILAETHRSGFMENSEGDVEEWDLENVHGVSIYAPFGEELYVGLGCTVSAIDHCAANDDPQCIKIRDYYTTTEPFTDPYLFLAQDTAWDEFVNGFIDAHYCIGAQGPPPMRSASVLMEIREPNYDVDEWSPWHRPIGGVTTISLAWGRGYSVLGLGRSYALYLPPILRDR